MRRVVVCCDGTWNVADPADGSPTNVVKFALNVAEKDGEVEQIVRYDPGVGTGVRDRLRGGVFGFGLSRNVREAYRFLAENVEDGDQVFLVGFSRGAFTVRSVAGLIENCGLVRRENVDRVDEAYRIYRSERPGTEPGGIAADLFRRTYGRRVPIRFLGVFDTVGALGIPFSGPRLGKLLNGRWAFHHTDLGASVVHACHALAIDERRVPYKPSLWTAGSSRQQVEQVWFRGVHSEVGGGASDASLSDIALLWLADRARSNELAFVGDAFQDSAPDPERARRRGLVVRPVPERPPSRQGFLWRLVGLADRGFERENDPPIGGRDESVASTVVGTSPPASFEEAAAQDRITQVSLRWTATESAPPVVVVSA